MALLWLEEPPGEWAILALTPPVVPLRSRRNPRANATELRQATAAAGAAWHLITPTHENVWHNGLPLIAGIRALSDRDEIRNADGDTYYFTTEELAHVAPLPNEDAQKSCPRCRQHITPDSNAVRCPQCGIWHHQSDALPCWTYAPTCALCPQPSALDAGFQWTPEAL